MKYDIRKNWLSSFYLIKSRPVLLLPFIVVAFLEAAALELIYFIPRKPALLVAGPIVRKFFGEQFLHYPANLIVLPRLFYYAQVIIYVFAGVFMAAIAVNIFKNAVTNLPVRPKAVINNALSRYISFFFFGVIMVAIFFLAQKADNFIFIRYMNFAGAHLPRIILKLAPVKLALLIFVSNVIAHTFMIFTIPVIVIEKKAVLAAICKSIFMGGRYFLTVFGLIFLPFLFYLPPVLMRSVLSELVTKAFPEISIAITAVNIVIAIFVDSFVTICAAQFLLDKNRV